MATIQGEQAIQRLAAVMQKKDDPDDPGILADAGASLDDVFARIRATVERTNKACTGAVTLSIKLKGYRSKGGEVAVDVEAGVSSKAPAQPKRETILFLDHDGHAHTTPQQEEMALFQPRAVDGGKGSKSDEKKGKAI